MYINIEGKIVYDNPNRIDDIIKLNFAIDKHDVPYGQFGITKNLPASNSTAVKDQIQSDLQDIVSANKLTDSVSLSSIDMNNNTVTVNLLVLNNLNSYKIQ